MEKKSQLPVAFLVFYVPVLIIPCNLGCECREVSSSSLPNPNHSNFIKETMAKRKPWCGNDPQSCARAHMHEPGKWECCAKKYCVDLDSNEYNCGRCGHPCGFGLHCCKGKCVDLLIDPNHCGSCFTRCHHEKCVFGICGYGQGHGYTTHNQIV